MVEDRKIEFERLGKEEEELSFESFSREDAYELGVLIAIKAKSNPLPLGIRIILNGTEVFRYYPTGITKDHELWLERKRRSVEFREMSTWRLKAMAEMNEQTLEDWLIDPTLYVIGGGGYPIKLVHTGMIGSICVSGYPDLDDHNMIVECIKEIKEAIIKNRYNK